MNARLIPLISLVFVLSVAGHVQADTANWTDAGNDSLWSNPDNWDLWPMHDGTWVKIVNGENGATLDSDGFECQKMHIGGDKTFTVLDGAGLTMPQDLTVGRGGPDDAEATMDMQGGTINIGRDFELGRERDARVIMTGGTINVTRDLEIPKTDQTHTAHFDLHGGTLNLTRELRMNYKDPAVANGTMDITAGTLITAAGDGDETSRIQEYVDNGWITAYGGNGTIEMDFDITNEGRTTVTAVHRLQPGPVDGSMAPAGLTELSWTVPEPMTPGAAVPVDVYFTDDYNALWSFTNPDAIRVVGQSSVASTNVQTVKGTRYYWAVDTYIGDPNDPILGPIFSFVADNLAPEVAANDDVLTWLDNGSVDVAIGAAITDLDATTSIWTVISQPDDPNAPEAVIADPTALDTSITLVALGEYVLQLEADDGEKQGSDTLTINLYSDHCTAAQSEPDWEALPGDLNLDCVVDQTDLDLLYEQWLNSNALD